MNTGGVVLMTPGQQQQPAAPAAPAVAPPPSTSPPPIQVEDQLPQHEQVAKPEPLAPAAPQPQTFLAREQRVIIIVQRPAQPAPLVMSPTPPTQAPPPAPLVMSTPPTQAPMVLSPAPAPVAVLSPAPATVAPPAQTQNQRVWKKGEIYYSTGGPYPEGQEGGMLVYFDPKQMQPN